MFQTKGGVGKTGPCDAYWSQNNKSIVCTGKDNRWVEVYGFPAETKEFILKYHNGLRGKMDADNMMELVRITIVGLLLSESNTVDSLGWLV